MPESNRSRSVKRDETRHFSIDSSAAVLILRLLSPTQSTEMRHEDETRKDSAVASAAAVVIIITHSVNGDETQRVCFLLCLLFVGRFAFVATLLW